MNIHQDMYTIYNELRFKYGSSSSDFGILKLVIIDDSLSSIYKEKIEAHNKSFMDNEFADSGFDLFVPESTIFNKLFATTFIDMGVKAELVECNFQTNILTTSPFYMYPRSSISKTPLMLANHTGIIDAGYRGNLIGAFRALEFDNTDLYLVDKHTRLLQVCHPSLCPMYVVIVKEDDLTSTTRGSGGFGSTGK